MDDEHMIIELYREEYRAMVARDIEVLQRILAPTMTLTHISGTVQSKEEWLSQIEDGQMRYFSYVEDAIEHVKVEGDKASLVGKNRVQANIWGSGTATWPLEMEFHFERQDGKWVIVRQVASMY